VFLNRVHPVVLSERPWAWAKGPAPGAVHVQRLDGGAKPVKPAGEQISFHTPRSCWHLLLSGHPRQRQTG